MKQLPSVLRFRGTTGRIPDDQRGAADVIRVPSGPGLILKDPEPVLQILETACRIHPIERIILEGPWPCHDNEGLEAGRLKYHMLEMMKAAQAVIEAEFPHLKDVYSAFDDQLFYETDWQAPLKVERLNCQCMDPRLDRLISRLKDKHGERIMIIRWAGSTAAILDGEKPYGECLAREYQRLFKRLQQDGQPLPLLEMTSHRECAYIGIPDEDLELARHEELASSLTDWVRRTFTLPLEVATSLLFLDGKVQTFSPQAS